MAHQTRTCPYCGEPIKPGAKAAPERYGLASARDVAEKTEPVAPAPGEAVVATGPKTSGQAIASFLFAVLGAGLGAIPALVLGERARREIQWSGRQIGGLRWAVAGQVIGVIQLAVLVVIALILLWNGGEERTPPTPDGPIPVTQVFAEDGLVSDVSARKSGDLVSVSFTLHMLADECKAYALPDHGQRVAGLLEPGIHTITITRSGSATEAYLSCSRPPEDLNADGRNTS